MLHIISSRMLCSKHSCQPMHNSRLHTELWLASIDITAMCVVRLRYEPGTFISHHAGWGHGGERYDRIADELQDPEVTHSATCIFHISQVNCTQSCRHHPCFVLLVDHTCITLVDFGMLLLLGHMD